MLLAATAILVGFVVLIWSADLFVAGAASIAENMGLSPVIIGLTIVSIGTSAPEILVSITATLSGAGELAIGNAIGSNIANIGLVLGTTVLVAPMCVHPSCIRKELPALLVVTAGTGLLILDGELSRLDGGLMMAALAFILYQVVRNQDEGASLLEEAGGDDVLPHLNPLRAWLTFALGMIMLIASSRALVWGATEVALFMGVSQLVIGLTIVAIGTSLPELAATIASALRGHTEIAVGNVIGSNLFNLLAVMSIPGLIQPELLDAQVLPRDYATMSAMTAMLALAIYLGRLRKRAPAGHSYIGRSAGVLFVAIYALYYYWLYQTR
ncbi:calcium/sodium antiporter [Parahaliea mediterranea]|uniref:Calcium/sodium antiporter n=1 Tax=Parahaliea mediterranea TaxID=651086 RepID=A0A939IKW1_9GAMM|nr:calcium/sodium antiporter [Parahaliea mediterranea]MBN7795348.1 calcium/sodium antiporter [Parahaliea mediterranea]